MNQHTQQLPLVKEAVAVIVANICAQDAAAEKSLLDDPRGAFKEYANVELPADLSVRAVRNSDAEAHVVIPDYAGLAKGSGQDITQMSDEDLQKLAAGEIVVGLFVAGVVGTAAVGAAVTTSVGVGVGVGVGVPRSKKKK